MTADDQPQKIHIDSDWKAEAQQEKERLAQQESTEKKHRQMLGQPTILNVINTLAMQAAVALGGMRGPQGETVPPDPELARFHIDMLTVLEEKTAGNLSDDEQRALAGVLHELRAMYVQSATAGAVPPRS